VVRLPLLINIQNVLYSCEFENIELYESDVTSKEFLGNFNESFDVIRARFVLVRISENEALFKELVSMLKPGC